MKGMTNRQQERIISLTSGKKGCQKSLNGGKEKE